jgi:seryl-tRNA synthetase
VSTALVIHLLREKRQIDGLTDVRDDAWCCDSRFNSVELVDECIALDNDWRSKLNEKDEAAYQKNAKQKEVGAKKKAKEPCDELVAEVAALKAKVVELEKEVEEVEIKLKKKFNHIGNLVDDTVPVSNDEEKDSQVVATWGQKPFGPAMLHHHDILYMIGGYEPERGVKVAGHRAYFLTDVGVMLNQALVQYGLHYLRRKQYRVLQPPYFMNKEVMAGVAQLEEFDEALYHVAGSGDGEGDKYLIATSEQPICAFHKDEWIEGKELPKRYGGISTCFRKEAGSSGKDVWGIFRVHQFEKVEQFVLCEPDIEISRAMQLELSGIGEEFYQNLGLPYHIINIVSGELNNAAIKKLDLEAWFPGYDAYRELVSCSNCTDYQSRSMKTTTGAGKDKKFVHMLNSTLVATTRTLCCILENYQTPNGVHVPECLVPYMGGMTHIPYVRGPKQAKEKKGSKDKGGKAKDKGGKKK